MTHICVGNLTIVGSDNGLSPGRRQAIIWTNAGILLIGFWGTDLSDIFNKNFNIFFHAYAWQIGPFWQDTLEILCVKENFPVFW